MGLVCFLRNVAAKAAKTGYLSQLFDDYVKYFGQIVVFRCEPHSQNWRLICFCSRLIGGVVLVDHMHWNRCSSHYAHGADRELEMIGIRRMFANVAIVFLLAVGTVAGATAGTTMQNMQTAFNGESNAHLRYLAFAEQADRENYGEVA